MEGSQRGSGVVSIQVVQTNTKPHHSLTPPPEKLLYIAPYTFSTYFCPKLNSEENYAWCSLCI